MPSETPEVLNRQSLTETARRLVKRARQVQLRRFEDPSEISDGTFRLVAEFDDAEGNPVEHFSIEYHATHTTNGGPFYAFEIGSIRSRNQVRLSVAAPAGDVGNISDKTIGILHRQGEKWTMATTSDDVCPKCVPFDSLDASQRSLLTTRLHEMEACCAALPVGTDSDAVLSEQRILQEKYRDFVRLSRPQEEEQPEKQ